MVILILLCGGVRVNQVMDAPHLLCTGLIVCLLLHLHSLSLGLIHNYCGIIDIKFCLNLHLMYNNADIFQREKMIFGSLHS